MKQVKEDMPANVTGDSASMSMPPTAVSKTMQRRYKMFDVKSETFRRFQTGRMKFERWARFLNMGDVAEKSIYDYATRNRNDVIVLRDSDTGALRAIRRRASLE
jgi:hypothetical protein